MNYEWRKVRPFKPIKALGVRLQNGGWLNRRGIGIITEGGCTGSTWGEEGNDYTRSVEILFLRYTVTFYVNWKKL